MLTMVLLSSASLRAGPPSLFAVARTHCKRAADMHGNTSVCHRFFTPERIQIFRLIAMVAGLQRTFQFFGSAFLTRPFEEAILRARCFLATTGARRIFAFNARVLIVEPRGVGDGMEWPCMALLAGREATVVAFITVLVTATHEAVFDVGGTELP